MTTKVIVSLDAGPLKDGKREWKFNINLHRSIMGEEHQPADVSEIEEKLARKLADLIYSALDGLA